MAASGADIKKIIYASLSNQTLGRALAQLTLLTKGTTNEALEDIKSNYQRLLQHWAFQVADPEREAIFVHLLRQTYELADDLLAARSARPIATDALFAQFWEPKRYSASLVEEVKRLNQQGDALTTAWAVSAITINCIEYFDENKFLCLFECCQSAHKIVAMRALTGLILCLLLYKDRYRLYPSINNKLQLLLDDETTRKYAQHIVKQLIRNKETDRITKDIQQNILPTLNELAPKLHEDILSRSNFDSDEYEEAAYSWNEQLEETGIQDKVETYAQMQMEGSDINFSTFSSMKSYPFFQLFENWVQPFHPQNAAIGNLFVSEDSEQPLSTLLELTRFLCDSDKYSFCLNLQMLPENLRKSMVEQIRMGDEQTKEWKAPSEASICNLYLQDLYRFYTLYPNKEFFTNPFLFELNWNDAPFCLIDSDGTYILQMADFLFAKEEYAMALASYQAYKKEHKLSITIYKKIAYCHQKMGNFEAATKIYDDLWGDGHGDCWIARKNAYCHRMLQDWEPACCYYEEVAKEHPNDINVIYNIGCCYAEMKYYHKALNAFYKVEFLQSDMSKSIYYHLYMAHCLWATGEKEKALEHYALFPHDQLAEQLDKACITLSTRDKVYIVDYLRYK